MFAWLLSLVLACTVDEQPARTPEAPTAPTALTTPTWTDVAPILARCAGCHDDSGLTWRIAGYDDAASLAPIIAAMVSSRRMPPWRAGPLADVRYADDPSLTDVEIATVVAWAEADAPLGDADPDVPLVGPPRAQLPRVDAVWTMAEPYVPEHSPDDHRCFVLDRGDAEDAWVTGIEVLPQNLAAAHHLMVLAVETTDPENTPLTADAADPGPGFDCKEVTAGSFPGSYQQLGGWLPGRGATLFPEGAGVFLSKDATVLLKAHYFTPSPGGEADLTQVRVMVEPEITVEAAELKVNNGEWTRHASIAVPAGETSEHRMVSTVAEEAAQMADIDPGNGLQVHWVLLHMHELGVSARLSVRRGGSGPDAEEFVLLDIPDWDFDWQLEYWLAEPFFLEADDELELECTHTNPGPEDVWWGELTSDEMCIARMFVSEPPADGR